MSHSPDTNLVTIWERSMPIQSVEVLLVDTQPDSIRLVEEAFTEFEETRFRRGWTQPMRMVLAADAIEACELLAAHRFDALLLSLSGCDGEPLAAFHALRASAPQLPMLLLAPASDESLALNLVRQGAQDYLLQEDLDCWPLMHALRAAMERQKVTRARQSFSLQDDLTQLYNEHGFRHLVHRDAQVAARHGLQLALAVAVNAQGDDLADLELAEVWRDLFEPADLTARIGQSRFAASSIIADHEEALALEQKLVARLPAATMKLLTPAVCATEFDSQLDELLNLPRRLGAAAAAHDAACDNGSFENRARRHV